MPQPKLARRDDALNTEPFDDSPPVSSRDIAENQYLFIEGNNLEQRFQQNHNQNFCITDLGFGDGLNFLLTWQAWLAHRQHEAQLHYIGIDAHPMRKADLIQATAHWPALAPLATSLLTDWPAATAGCHRLRWPDQGLTLDLWWEDTETALADLASRRRHWVDAWFFDCFIASIKPENWCAAIYHSAALLSRSNATLACFSAADDVCHGLDSAGFEVSQRPGFDLKPAAISGYLRQTTTTQAVATPWDLVPTATSARDALVVGAGLAGAHVARSLAERGFNVHVVEQSEIASGGSSNLQGITYTRLSRKTGTLADFAVLSYQQAIHRYRQLFASGQLTTGIDGAQTGYLQLSEDKQTLAYLTTALEGDNQLAQVLDAAAASERLGLEVHSPGIYYPDAYWLNPPAVCRALLDHPAIRVTSGVGALALLRAPPSNLGDSATQEQMQRTPTDPHDPETGGWFVLDRHDQVIGAAPIAVVATALNSLDSQGLDWLPLQGIRGQTTHISMQEPLSHMRTALCHEGYIAPARLGVHCIGATYKPNDTALDERLEDHAFNVAALRRALPKLGPLADSESLNGHVAIRCTSSDYLPLIGAVPDYKNFVAAYRELGKRRKKILDIPAPLLPNLYLSTGFGSRGLTAAPLAAELIASEICAEPTPLPRYLQQALSPARFLIRDIIRGKR